MSIDLIKNIEDDENEQSIFLEQDIYNHIFITLSGDHYAFSPNEKGIKAALQLSDALKHWVEHITECGLKKND